MRDTLAELTLASKGFGYNADTLFGFVPVAKDLTVRTQALSVRWGILTFIRDEVVHGADPTAGLTQLRDKHFFDEKSCVTVINYIGRHLVNNVNKRIVEGQKTNSKMKKAGKVAEKVAKKRSTAAADGPSAQDENGDAAQDVDPGVPQDAEGEEEKEEVEDAVEVAASPAKKRGRGRGGAGRGGVSRGRGGREPASAASAAGSRPPKPKRLKAAQST